MGETHTELLALTLTRYETSPDWGTVGIITSERFNDQFDTIEPPIDYPEHGAILEGEYFCERYKSAKEKAVVWLLKDVPGKELIEMHVGNVWRLETEPGKFKYETTGCILLGLQMGTVYYRPGVLFSEVAFKKFMKLTEPYERLKLRVENKFPPIKKAA